MNDNADFGYEIQENIATISQKKNITLELKRISFREQPGRLDLRRWQGGAMLKGVTLSDQEARDLMRALEQYFK